MSSRLNFHADDAAVVRVNDQVHFGFVYRDAYSTGNLGVGA